MNPAKPYPEGPAVSPLARGGRDARRAASPGPDPSPAEVRVFLVDEQTLVRKALASLLALERDLKIVGESDGGPELIDTVLEAAPDVVLMDVMIRRGGGVEVARTLKSRLPHTEILILTAKSDQEMFRRAIEAGAVGYVLTDISPQNLCNAIRSVHSGKTVINPTIARALVENLSRGAIEPTSAAVRRQYGLTEREIDVIVAVAEGHSDKEIATRLFLSGSTVKTHLRSIYHKLKIRNRAQAAAFAVEKNLVVLQDAEPSVRKLRPGGASRPPREEGIRGRQSGPSARTGEEPASG
jgi:DNA-binding NarL/FixJ family response regulator